MAVSEQLEKFYQQFLLDFTIENKKLLKRDEVDYLTVFSSVMTIHGYAKYLKSRRWFYLLTIGLRSILKTALISVKSFTKKSESISNGSNLLIVCNSYLAFRELYIPLIKLDDNNLIFLFTSSQLEKQCLLMSNSLGVNVKTVTHEPDLSGIFNLCANLCMLLIDTLKLKSENAQQHKRQFFLIGYAVFTALPLLAYMQGFKQYIQRSRYYGLITDDVNDPCVRLVVELAKLKQLPTNIIQFGHYDKSSIEWRFLNSKILYPWGDFYKRLIINHPECKDIDVKVIGSPRFDYLFKKEKSEYEGIKSRKFILVLSTYAIENYGTIANNLSVIDIKTDIVNLLMEFLNENEVHILVKPHPYESEPELDIWRSCKEQCFNIMNKNDDVRAIISDADLVLSFGTGLTLDCLVAGVPVIIPNWIENYPWEYSAVINAGAIPANTKNEFRDLLKNILYDNNSKNELVNQTGLNIRDFVHQTGIVSEALLQSLQGHSLV